MKEMESIFAWSIGFFLRPNVIEELSLSPGKLHFWHLNEAFEASARVKMAKKRNDSDVNVSISNGICGLLG